jgi:hypothetical protein
MVSADTKSESAGSVESGLWTEDVSDLIIGWAYMTMFFLLRTIKEAIITRSKTVSFLAIAFKNSGIEVS